MSETLLIFVYILLIILLIVAILLGIKLIFTLNKVDDLVDDVTTKVRSLDKVFEVTELLSSKMSSLVESVFGFATKSVKKIMKRSKKIEEDDEDE